MEKGLFRKLTLVGISLMLIIAAGCANSNTADDGPGDSADDNAGDSASGEKVTLTAVTRWVEFNDLLVDTLIPEFEANHPNIEIQQDTSFREDYVQTLQTAVSGGNLPDIFASHPSLPTYTLYELDVLHELDDVIGDLKDDYERGMWTTGGTVMDGHIYALPLFSNKKDAILMYYNKEILSEAGLSEDDVPTTWSELVEVSKIVTEQTDAYGTFFPINHWTMGSIISQMASAITPEVTGAINYHTGEYDYNTEGNIESIEFIKTMVDEGLNEPSAITREGAEGPAVFAGGQAAFFFDGPWATTEFAKEGFEDYGVAPIPTKDGKPQYVGYSGADLKGGLHVRKDTEHIEEVKTFLNYLIEEGYTAMVEHGAGYPPIDEIVANMETPDTEDFKASQLQHETFIHVPDPILQNEEAVKVKTEMSGKGTDKSLTDVVEGYVTGQITDLEGILQEMTDEQNEAFENALKKVQDDGIDIDQSAWVFPDWEPLTPYEID